MASIDDVLAKAQRRTVTVPVCLRGDLISEHARRAGELDQALLAGVDDTQALELADIVAGIEADLRDATVEFVFVNVGRARWTELLSEHPPTEEQKKLYGRRFDHNPDTFPHAAIAASCTAPDGMTADKVHQLEEIVSAGQWQALWAGCLEANVGGAALGESTAASAVLRRLRPSSEPPAPTASAAASSSAGQ